MPIKLTICIVGFPQPLRDRIRSQLSGQRYSAQEFAYSPEFHHFIEHNKEKIDCLILYNQTQTKDYAFSLSENGIFLPAVIVSKKAQSQSQSHSTNRIYYHNAEFYLPLNQLDSLVVGIDKALTRFLHLGASCILTDKTPELSRTDVSNDRQAFLLQKQRRLAEKLEERLGYFGIYYNRNSDYFYRNLSPQERQEFHQQLAKDYREIILSYFEQDPPVNQAIDQFVNQAFFADISVSQILEIHMTLMDDFAQQLKLEGRSEEILLDYRLTLIDIIAHLCEMYRRSIPREESPFELSQPID